MAMKPGITTKLFLAVLVTGILVTLAMGVAAHISFTRGFLGYLNDQGIERAENLLPTLSAAYKARGSWEFLRGNKLSALVWNTYEAIVDACVSAWHFLIGDPERIRSIGTRDWACVSV